MQDQEILSQIGRLVDEEHELMRREAAGELADPDNHRMRELEVSLDQCWDLLRQRRARRAAHLDPDDAHVRSADVVEHYKQ